MSLGVQFSNAVTSLNSNTIIRKAKAFVNSFSEKSSKNPPKFSERYENAEENSDILAMVEKVKSGKFKDNEKLFLGNVTKHVADEILAETKIDVRGFKVAIEARQISHILKDHGENGLSDQSMANPSDIAKMEFVINNHDDIREAGQTQAYKQIVNGKTRAAKTVLYETRIGKKSYYVVQAVPDTKAKTLYIVTAFIGKSGYKKEASQIINAKNLDVTAKTESANASNNSISQKMTFVNSFSEKSSKNPHRFSERYENAEENFDIWYSDRDNFVSEINQWNRDGKPDGETFVLGSTGNVLQGLGAIENDIYMQGDKIKQILSDHPEMTLAEIKKIPQILENPALILKSKNVGRGNKQNTRLVIFGNIKAQNGLPVLAVLDLRPSENHFIIEDWQKVTSSYTKTNDPISFVRNSDVLYAEKKRATSVLRSIGFHMPIELNENGFIGSISYTGRSVNIFGESFSNIFSEGLIKYSDRDPDSLSNRSLLANALETTTQNDIEKNKLAEYKQKIELIESEEAKLHDLRAQIKELSFAKGSKDTAKIKELQFEANQAANRINTYDRQLLTLEASKPLKDVLEREKKLAYKKAEQKGKDAHSAYREKATKTQRKLMDRYQESREKAIANLHSSAVF